VLAIVLLVSGSARAGVTAPLAGFALLGSGSAGGTIWRGAIPGGLQRSLVYLPPGYSTSVRYPVVYLLHGMPGEPTEYADSLDLADLGDELIEDGSVRPFVAVVPAAGPDPHYDGEWAGPWERYLVEQVVPWADAHLSTLATRQSRTFVHASRSAIEWNTPTIVLKRRAATLRALGTRFFLSTGPGHGLIHPADTLAFDREVAGLGLVQRYWSYPSKQGMYEAQLAAGLRYALGASVPASRREAHQFTSAPITITFAIT
jgi:Putative esterase